LADLPEIVSHKKVSLDNFNPNQCQTVPWQELTRRYLEQELESKKYLEPTELVDQGNRLFVVSHTWMWLIVCGTQPVVFDPHASLYQYDFFHQI